MLFSGCWAVSVTPAVWQWVRNRHDSGLVAPYTSFMRRAQMRRAARSLAISSKKSLWMSKKKLRRGAKASTSSPRAMPRSTYSKPLRRVKASSCPAVAPASRMW